MSCIVPSLAPPPQAALQLNKEGCPTQVNTYGPTPLPPYNVSAAPRQRNMARMKEQSKASERELSNEDIARLSDGEFKALVINMLTELTELGQKMKGQMKDTQNEIKKNIHRTNSDRKETRTQSNDLELKEKINIQLDQNEELRIQKNEETEESLGQLETFHYPNYSGARRRTRSRN